MRAHLNRSVTDSAGNIVTQQLSVRVLQPGTTTAISDIVYADGTSSTALDNPWTVSNGQISFYLAQPQRIRLGVTIAGVESFTEDLDVLAATTDSAHAGTGPNSVQVGLSATATADSAVALGVSSAATGSHSVAAGHQTAASDDQTVSVGEQAVASAPGALALGAMAVAAGSQGTAVGNTASAPYAASTAVGAGALTTSTHQVMLGTNTETVETPGPGLVLASPNGTRFLLSVNNAGQLVVAAAPALDTAGG